MWLPVIVIAKAKVQPDKREMFIAAARHCAEMTRTTEPGCLEYDFYESQTEPCTFTFVERWTDRTAIDAHMLTPHLGELMRIAGLCLASAPSIEAVNVASVDRLV
jgi:quinol monooxygenase YgiN